MRLKNLENQISEALTSIKKIPTSQLEEIASYHSPPSRIKDVLKTIIFLVYRQRAKWDVVLKMMKSPNFI